MRNSWYLWTVALLSVWFTGSISVSLGTLPASTSIDCETPKPLVLAHTEEYNGLVEVVNITQGVEIILESPSCPDCASFLTLDHSAGEDVASVVTQKPLDAEALKKCNGSVSSPPLAYLTFSYSITCNNKVQNNRTLVLYDMNDNAPVFEEEEYSVNISEATPVNSFITQVKAIDEDISSLYNDFSYYIEPPITTFEIWSDGSIFLKERLNSSETELYNVTVRARDLNNNTGETTVLVHVRRKPGPHFQHHLYEAMIHENRVGPFESVEPEPIEAKDGDQEVIYSIKKVSPQEYWGHFSIGKENGVINVEKKLDREKECTIKIVIMASLKTSSWQSTEATVVVSVADVREPPVFSSKDYRAELFSAVPAGHPVVDVKATDPDVGDVLQYTLVVPSSKFAVVPSSGRVYVVSVAGGNGTVSLQVKAEDQSGLYDTATVEVTIKSCEENNVVKIYLNVPVDSIKNKTADMKQALERVLRWSVEIIRISDRPEDSQSRLRIASSAETYVDFLALKQNSSVLMHKDAVKERLKSERTQLLTELQAVFGPDVDFGLVPEGPELPINAVVLIALGTLAGIGITIGVIYTQHRLMRKGNTMETILPSHSNKRKDSKETMPTFNTDGTRETGHDNPIEMHYAPAAAHMIRPEKSDH